MAVKQTKFRKVLNTMISLSAPIQKCRITIKDEENTHYLDLYDASSDQIAGLFAKALPMVCEDLAGVEIEFKVRAKRSSGDDDDND